MMQNFRKIAHLFILLLFLSSCELGSNIDKEKPFIDLTIQDAFPVNCDTLYFGESFELKLRFSDNAELGSYSIDIHHNFDHHSHTTEVTECVLGPKKAPVNPITFIEDYEIPEGLKEYETNVSISLASGDGNGLYDEGDYHFFISLVDREGWSEQKGLSIKMLHRDTRGSR
jgi:hypothetical protein